MSVSHCGHQHGRVRLSDHAEATSIPKSDPLERRSRTYSVVTCTRCPLIDTGLVRFLHGIGHRARAAMRAHSPKRSKQIQRQRSFLSSRSARGGQMAPVLFSMPESSNPSMQWMSHETGQLGALLRAKNSPEGRVCRAPAVGRTRKPG